MRGASQPPCAGGMTHTRRVQCMRNCCLRVTTQAARVDNTHLHLRNWGQRRALSTRRAKKTRKRCKITSTQQKGAASRTSWSGARSGKEQGGGETKRIKRSSHRALEPPACLTGLFGRHGGHAGTSNYYRRRCPPPPSSQSAAAAAASAPATRSASDSSHRAVHCGSSIEPIVSLGASIEAIQEG